MYIGNITAQKTKVIGTCHELPARRSHIAPLPSVCTLLRTSSRTISRTIHLVLTPSAGQFVTPLHDSLRSPWYRPATPTRQPQCALSQKMHNPLFRHLNQTRTRSFRRYSYSRSQRQCQEMLRRKFNTTLMNAIRLFSDEDVVKELLKHSTSPIAKDLTSQTVEMLAKGMPIIERYCQSEFRKSWKSTSCWPVVDL